MCGRKQRQVKAGLEMLYLSGQDAPRDQELQICMRWDIKAVIKL